MNKSVKNKILFLKEDYADGQGSFTYPDGSKYAGEFKNGEFNGRGIFTHPDGGTLEGEWKDDELVVGQGEVISPEGQKYVGEISWKAVTKFENLVAIMAKADWEKVQERGF